MLQGPHSHLHIIQALGQLDLTLLDVLDLLLEHLARIDVVLVVPADFLFEFVHVQLDVALQLVVLVREHVSQLGGLVLEGKDHQRVVGYLLVYLQDLGVDFLQGCLQPRPRVSVAFAHLNNNQPQYQEHPAIIQAIRLLQMDLETRPAKQSELRQVFANTEELIQKRVDSLVAQLETLANGSTELDLLQNIHLDQALTEIASKAYQKREKQLNEIPEEQEIDQEIKNELKQQSQALVDQIATLNMEIEQLNAARQKHELARKLTQRKILQVEQEKLALAGAQGSALKYRGHLCSPAFQFCYQKRTDSQIVFKKDFVGLTNHLLNRISQNCDIIEKLENSVQAKIQENESASASLQELEQRQKKHSHLAQKIKSQRHQFKLQERKLKNCIERATSQITVELPQRLDKNLAKMWHRNQQLEHAYNQILELLKNACDAVDIDKISQYIEQL